MDSLFSWNSTFLTNLESVDEQHQRLVRLINDLGELVLSSTDVDRQSLESVRNKIFDYVKVHFADEEALMLQEHLDPRHIEFHREQHKNFTAEALQITKPGNELHGDAAKQLAEYLVHWLAYHILGVDQNMARQIKEIRSGSSPAAAFEAEQDRSSSSTQPLLAAMNGLFVVVSQRNRELREFNKELEQRVLDRTLELEKANTRLLEQSTHDELTGLPNRRFAMLSLNQLWLEKNRYGTTLSVLMIDVDHFKQVNDQFGHAQGDALLRTLARRFRESVRASDIVCRLGGDEFLVICPHSNVSGAEEVARKIQRNSLPFSTDAGIQCWDGSLSIGAVEANASTGNFDDLLKAADHRMYADKTSHKKGADGSS